MLPNVYIIEDDETMSYLLANYIKDFANPTVFKDAITAISEIENDAPKLIFLDILLDGPDGFTFLNEIVSYEDTAKIPVVIISSLNLNIDKLENYGVIKILKKESMLPEDVKNITEEVLNAK